MGLQGITGYPGPRGIKVSYIHIVSSVTPVSLIFRILILNPVLNIITYLNLFNFRETSDPLEILGRKARRSVDGIHMYYCLNE